MKIELDTIRNFHKDKPCVVACHGPSLNFSTDRIEKLQREERLLRFSVNEWYSFFTEKPDYWVVSNGEFTIKNSIIENHIWNSRGYPKNVFNKYNVPLLYNATADLTKFDFIEKHLKCDYLPYDTKHFKKHKCSQILKNFKHHYDNHKNLDYRDYGNNSQMWSRPNTHGVHPMVAQVHGHIAPAWRSHGDCCNHFINKTLQEHLQEISGHSKHAGPGQTVGMFAIMLAIYMGCNPIYITGMDLDYSVGYANTDVNLPINFPNVGHWKHVFRDFILDDMKIIKESAEKLDIKIINLDRSSWHDVFVKGELP